MSYSKKGLSASELQRQLDYWRYNAIWSLMHRIRQAMGKGDALYKLQGMIEFDQGYFDTPARESNTHRHKAGRGSQKVSNVAVMAESTPLEEVQIGKITKSCRYFKMKALHTHKACEINQCIRENLSEKSIAFGDKSTSYVDIGYCLEVHVKEKSSKGVNVSTLKWVHIAIGKAKRTLLGIYHKIKGKYLQNYLDEFCYEHKRRYFGEALFDRLLVAATHQYWYKCV